MCQCKTCECAVCSRWARTCVMCVEAQRIPTGTDVQDGHSSRLASLFFSTQVLLRYAAHAGDCNPLFGPRFQGRSLSPAFFLFFGESIS